FVAYFMDYMVNGDDDCYANIVNSEADGYDPEWGLNMNWEVPIEMENSTDAYVPYPPYVGAKCTFERDPAAIKVFAKPTVNDFLYSDVNDELWVIAMNASNKVILGVLDHDLDNICVEVAGLKINTPDASDILETEIVFEGNESVVRKYNFLMQNDYYAQLLKYPFKRYTYNKPEIPDTPEQPDTPLGVDDVDLLEANVSAGKGYIVVTSSVPSEISVLGLTGIEVIPSLHCSSRAQFYLNSGIYIVNINSMGKVLTKKVLVK
ncbi:MAG: T9SS type A sorting domain-containing protein, partial [Bacteroidales bacterium]|nr:T9SS type A sorting domain-containing protein [Bacteroidales bacterium]